MSVDAKLLRELHAAATPGPWRAMCSGNSPLEDGRLVGQSRLDPVPRPYEPRWVGWLYKTHHFETYLTDADANLIAALRNEAPALLDELEKLRAVHGQDCNIILTLNNANVHLEAELEFHRESIVSQESELDRLRLKILHYQRALVSLGPLVGEARADIEAESRAAKEGDRG